MQDKRVIINNTDGSVAILIPAPNCGLTLEQIIAKDVPSGVAHETVDVAAIPSDRTFRNAWKHDAIKKIDIDIPKAKGITHDRRRVKREAEFAPHDKIVSRQIPGTDSTAAEAARQAIRDKYAAMQVEIDACATADQLKAIIDREGL